MGNRLQKIQKLFKKTPNALFCLLGAVVFLAGVYFISYRTAPWEVWLPSTMNNDEAIYNREVVSVITHGGCTYLPVRMPNFCPKWKSK